MNRIGIIIPTYNPGSMWSEWIERFKKQSLMPDVRLIVDSSSTDGRLDAETRKIFGVHTIGKSDFNHGGTRQMALERIAKDIDIVIFMTQDALLFDTKSLQNLVRIFSENSNVGAVYGRQLPHMGSRPSEAHARIFNYADQDMLKSITSIEEYGIKSIFISNSFSAYRVSDLMGVGGFPSNVILGEDTMVAAKLLMAGKSVYYQADACVHHSHHYTYAEEFKRYFDIGVLHGREPWLLSNFGKVGGEGMRYLRSEMRFLMASAWYIIPSALIRTACKFAGYKIGRYERLLPTKLKKMFSMYKVYWLTNK
ncbi:MULTISPECIES: glycosyltransferase family 2 protein [unclassified Janthinobacterium]|uniref:glycosyltransferase family 2 protein n=1 Tax=unclassified Janthinobacterium TaxID=2610881 RepID=UPI000881B83D|nr:MULTISPECIES: glycosyltransferase [unclassified Janthinobacterium]SDA81998.1 rhamnosyltransferase [Janthinobacterium sp. 551a]SFB64665.1 rhamnosyltransferase [Janthinobacterium sp. 344]